MDWDWTHLHFVVVCNKIRQPFLEIRAEREGEGACMDNDEIHIEGERRGERERERERGVNDENEILEFIPRRHGCSADFSKAIPVPTAFFSPLLSLSLPLNIWPLFLCFIWLLLHLPLFILLILSLHAYPYFVLYIYILVFICGMWCSWWTPIEFEVSCLLENKIIFCC